MKELLRVTFGKEKAMWGARGELLWERTAANPKQVTWDLKNTARDNVCSGKTWSYFLVDVRFRCCCVKIPQKVESWACRKAVLGWPTEILETKMFTDRASTFIPAQLHIHGPNGILVETSIFYRVWALMAFHSQYRRTAFDRFLFCVHEWDTYRKTVP